MKKFFKSRSGAIVIAVVVILLSTYFGIYRSLSVAVREVSDGFDAGVTYTDESGNTYLHKSIRSQLKNKTEAGMSLASIADIFPDIEDEANALRNAYNTMRDLIYNDGTPSELFTADKELTATFNALYAVLPIDELDSKDIKRMEECKTTMSGADGEIETSGYNEAVREFDRKVLSVFPTNILKNICFVEPPELFE